MTSTTLEIAKVRQPLVDHLSARLALDADDARVSVDHLLRAEQAGKSSHGLIRVHYLSTSGKFGPFEKTPAPRPRRACAGRLDVDGHGHLGYPLMQKLIADGCAEAKRHGTCVAAGSPVYPSGCLGDWARLACAEGVALVMVANSPRRVAAYGGRRPIIGTNAICVGIPTAPMAFVADCATSEISHGALLVARTSGSPLPPNSAVDATGALTTSAADVDPTKGRGALLPFGGSHKAYAIAMAIELLACLGGGAPGEERAGRHGVFCHFIGPDVLAPHIERLSIWLCELDATGTRIPGWTSGRRANDQIARGVVEVSTRTLEALQALGLLARAQVAETPPARGRGEAAP